MPAAATTDVTTEPAATSVPAPALPAWAQVSEKRRQHVARVTAMLLEWAPHVARDAGEANAMRDAGLLHDALRDAPEAELRALSGDERSPVDLLHGPAAATLLERHGETRGPLLDAVRWHTLGSAAWDRVGRALYMADFLEPGRKFAAADRAFLAARVPTDFDGVFRQVVRLRLEWSLREGKELFPQAVALWNAIR
jgi:2-amino-4-hydroxy-6-hydroxymethyldihydropteridine diphosphokinase